jgi:hypothetical protein
MSEKQRKDAETQRRKAEANTLLASSHPGAVAFSESEVEQAVLACLEALGWRRDVLDALPPKLITGESQANDGIHRVVNGL